MLCFRYSSLCSGESSLSALLVFLEGLRKWSAGYTWVSWCVSFWWRWPRRSSCFRARPHQSCWPRESFRRALSPLSRMRSECQLLFCCCCHCVSIHGWELQTPVFKPHVSCSLHSHCRNNEGLLKAEQILLGLGLTPSAEDCVATQRVCQIVSTRAAHLCAASLAAVLRQIRDNKAAEKLRTTVGVDGSVYKNHPQWVLTGLHSTRCFGPASGLVYTYLDFFFLTDFFFFNPLFYPLNVNGVLATSKW